MGYDYMNPAPDKTGNIQKAFEYEVNLTGVSDGDWILIPDIVSNVTVTVSFGGGGKGKVQTTTDTVYTVKTGSPVAVDWSSGEVATTKQDAAFPVTAIRASQTFAGTMKMTVRAQ